MEKEVSSLDAQAAGFQSGYETNFCYSDKDVIASEGENMFFVSGW